MVVERTYENDEKEDVCRHFRQENAKRANAE